MADPRFSSALESITGMRDPLAGSAVTGRRQPAGAEAKSFMTPEARLNREYQIEDELTSQLGNLAVQSAEFEGLTKKEAASRAAEVAKGERQLAEERATTLAQPKLREERRQLRTERGTPFVPTQENMQEMAAIFSFIGVLGFAIGGGGKGNAIGAMNAMNGMMEGYRQGNVDRYQKEFNQFVTNMKSLDDRITGIDAELNDIAQLAAVSYDKGMAKLKEVALQNEADFLIKYADKVGLPKTIEMVKSLKAANDKNKDRLEKELARIATAQQKFQYDKMMEGMRQAGRRDIVVLRDSLRGDGKGGGQKLTEKDRSAHRLRENLIPELEEGIDILDRLNKEGQWSKMTTLLAADTRAAELAFKDDPEALKLIRTFAFFRSKEFETGGKALTRIEDRILAPLYRSDLRVYEAVRNAMVQGVTEMSREKARLEDQFPQLGGGTDRRGEIPAPKSMPSADKLKAYADANFGGDQTKAKDFLRSQGYQ
jgi:hypothetical protein